MESLEYTVFCYYYLFEFKINWSWTGCPKAFTWREKNRVYPPQTSELRRLAVFCSLSPKIIDWCFSLTWIQLRGKMPGKSVESNRNVTGWFIANKHLNLKKKKKKRLFCGGEMCNSQESWICIPIPGNNSPKQLFSCISLESRFGVVIWSSRLKSGKLVDSPLLNM